MWVGNKGGTEEGVGEVKRGVGGGVVGTGWIRLSLALAPFKC